MAADQFLLEKYNFNSKPIFRIYEWEIPTISIGKNEKIDRGINLDQCENLGIPIIRRSTGGQSVLHGFDMTYSFVGCTLNSSFSNSVLENYRYIAKGFYRFFEKLGLEPKYSTGRKKLKKLENHLCFAFPSNYEILVEGKKIIGNAQRVKKVNFTGKNSKFIFLQHGSIPLNDSAALIEKIFPDVNVNLLNKKMHSLESTGIFPKITKNKIKELLNKSFEEIFNLEWDYSKWNEEELYLISKYEKEFKSINI